MAGVVSQSATAKRSEQKPLCNKVFPRGSGNERSGKRFEEAVSLGKKSLEQDGRVPPWQAQNVGRRRAEMDCMFIEGACAVDEAVLAWK